MLSRTSSPLQYWHDGGGKTRGQRKQFMTIIMSNKSHTNTQIECIKTFFSKTWAGFTQHIY